MILVAALFVGCICFSVVSMVTGSSRARPATLRLPRRPANRERLWLQQAGLSLTPTAFWLGSSAAGALALLTISVVAGSVFVAAVPALAVAALPRSYYGRRRARRLGEVQRAWPDGLRDIVASIASGRSVGQAIVALADHGPPPLREAFGRFATLQRMLGTVGALEIVRDELADATSDRVIEVLVLAHERGGQLVAAILDDLVTATTRDLKNAAEIESEGLEMRINSRAVVVLPWLVLVLLTASEPSFRGFYASSTGLVVLIIGAVASAGGSAILSRLGRQPEDERLFGATA